MSLPHPDIQRTPESKTLASLFAGAFAQLIEQRQLAKPQDLQSFTPLVEGLIAKPHEAFYIQELSAEPAVDEALWGLNDEGHERNIYVHTQSRRFAVQTIQGRSNFPSTLETAAPVLRLTSLDMTAETREELSAYQTLLSVLFDNIKHKQSAERALRIKPTIDSQLGKLGRTVAGRTTIDFQRVWFDPNKTHDEDGRQVKGTLFTRTVAGLHFDEFLLGDRMRLKGFGPRGDAKAVHLGEVPLPQQEALFSFLTVLHSRHK